jgi:hypothetical protein
MVFTPKHCRAVSLAKRGKKLGPMPAEQKQKIMLARAKYVADHPGWGPMLGKRRSEESIAKMKVTWKTTWQRKNDMMVTAKGREAMKQAKVA